MVARRLVASPLFLMNPPLVVGLVIIPILVRSGRPAYPVLRRRELAVSVSESGELTAVEEGRLGQLRLLNTIRFDHTQHQRPNTTRERQMMPPQGPFSSCSPTCSTRLPTTVRFDQESPQGVSESAQIMIDSWGRLADIQYLLLCRGRQLLMPQASGPCHVREGKVSSRFLTSPH